MSYALEILEKCNVEVDLSKIQIPGGLELSLGDDHCIRLGSLPLLQCVIEDARMEYDKIKTAFEKGNYKLIIHPDYEPTIKII